MISGSGVSVGAGELLIVTGEDGTSALLRELAADVPEAARLVPAEPALHADRSVLAHGDPADPSWRELLDRLGLTEHADKLPFMLSRGTATRVQLAQAFWRRPDNLLFDQPFNGLDLRGREVFVSLVAEALAAGACIVVATHDLEAFAALPGTVVTLPLS